MSSETPLARMRAFYNLFPYPGRSLWLMPQRVRSWTSHAGFAFLTGRNPQQALFLWRKMRGHLTENAKGHDGVSAPIALVEKEFQSDKSILLVGCGTDEPLLFRVLHPVNSITAIDLSARSLAIAKRRLTLHQLVHPFSRFGATTFLEGDASEILEKSGSPRFDFVQCFGVLHHQPDAQRLLRAIASVLAPGGVLRLMIYAHRGRRLERRVQSRFSSRRDWWLQAWRLWFWQLARRLFPFGASGARFRYLGVSRRAVADAFLHPSDPGLPLETLLLWARELGLECQFCEAKFWQQGWRASAGVCSDMLDQVISAEKRAEVLSNVVLVFRKRN